MNISYYPAQSRGGADYDWLKTNYSFSFAYYMNPRRMGFGPLRVLNDDWIAANSGFPPHSHANMEIITIPFSGTLSHKDSSGGEGTVAAGEVQLMSAGTGITHSEYNTSLDTPVTLFQIWVEPNQMNVAPRYEEKDFEFSKVNNTIKPFITPTGENDTFQIYQDAYFSWAHISSKQNLEYSLHTESHGLFTIVIDGQGSIDHQTLYPRDALEIRHSSSALLQSNTSMRVLLIEVPIQG